MSYFLSIGVFIDGGYYAKINRALKARERSIIRVKALFSYLCSEIALQEGVDVTTCQITEAHYFRGRFRVREAYDKHLLYNERKFEDTLIENDVVFHYKHLREVERPDGQTEVIEKGVDTIIKALKIHTVLLTWNLTDVDATSALLSDEAAQHWELSEKTDSNPELRRRLLYRLRETVVTQLGDNF